MATGWAAQAGEDAVGSVLLRELVAQVVQGRRRASWTGLDGLE